MRVGILFGISVFLVFDKRRRLISKCLCFRVAFVLRWGGEVAVGRSKVLFIWGVEYDEDRGVFFYKLVKVFIG